MLQRRVSHCPRRLVACSSSCTASRVCFVLSVLRCAPSDLPLDASDFLRKHPWPGRAISDTFDDDSHRKGSFYKKFLGALKVVCGKTGAEEDYDDEDDADRSMLYDRTESRSGEPFYWTPALQDNFREELEKCVPLSASHWHYMNSCLFSGW